MTDYCRYQNNSFLRNNVNPGHISISRQPKNRYCKLCVIPIIDNSWTFLRIKLFPSLSKYKFFLICTCLFKNNQKWFSSSFDCLTPRIQFINHPLDVHIYSPSENVLCDSFRLWHYLPFHPLQHGSKVWPSILVILHRHDWWLLLSLLYIFD